jgi:hypothetical protein
MNDPAPHYYHHHHHHYHHPMFHAPHLPQGIHSVAYLTDRNDEHSVLAHVKSVIDQLSRVDSTVTL